MKAKDIDHLDEVWATQGRTEEQKWAVRNFLTGAGKTAIEALIKEWVVENVEPYYQVLIQPRAVLDRHLFWSNFNIPIVKGYRDYTGEISKATVEQLSKGLGIKLPEGTKDKRKLLRNAVDPRIGLHILESAMKETVQTTMV